MHVSTNSKEISAPVPAPFESWGRYPNYGANIIPLHWQSDFPAITAGLHNGALPVGMGRSYGDVCLLKDGNLLLTTGMDRLIDFDPETAWNERDQTFKMAKDILKTRNVVQSAEGNAKGHWSTVVALGVFIF